VQDLSIILEALANRLAGMPELRGADAYFPDAMGPLPRAVLYWDSTSTVFRVASMLEARHTIEVYIVVEARASATKGIKDASGLVDAAISRLMGDVRLASTTPAANITQLTVRGVRPVTLTLGADTYFASVVSVEVEDKTVMPIS